MARILAGCRPLKGTPAETYLGSRGLNDPGCADLLYHPDLADFETTRGWAGMVTVVRDGTGQPTGGIHRTFTASVLLATSVGASLAVCVMLRHARPALAWRLVEMLPDLARLVRRNGRGRSAW